MEKSKSKYKKNKVSNDLAVSPSDSSFSEEQLIDYNIFYKCKSCLKIITTENVIKSNAKMQIINKKLKLEKNDILIFSKKSINLNSNKSNYIIESNSIICKKCSNKIGYCIIQKSVIYGILSLNFIDSKEVKMLKIGDGLNENNKIKIFSRTYSEYIALFRKVRLVGELVKDYLRHYYKQEITAPTVTIQKVYDRINKIAEKLNLEKI